MSHKNLTHDQEMKVESHAPYIKVWAALAVLTAIEYVYARLFKDSFGPLVAGLMVCAVIKAALVGWYFMHLKFEGNWVYAMLVPAAFLATALVVGLVPDIAMQPQDKDLYPEKDDAARAPVAPVSHSSASPRIPNLLASSLSPDRNG